MLKRINHYWRAYLHKTTRNKWLLLAPAAIVYVLGTTAGIVAYTLIPDKQISSIATPTGSQTDKQNEITEAESSKTDATTPDTTGGSGVPNANTPGDQPSQQTGQLTMKPVTVGAKSKCGCSSAQTANITTPAGGMLLAWVCNAVGGESVSPQSSISGLGLTWSVVGFYNKKPGAPRGMTLLKANLPQNSLTGPLTINYNMEPNGGHWFWVIDWTSGTNIVQIDARVDGGFLTNYQATLSPSSQPGNLAVAGILVGEQETIVSPGAGLTKLGQSPTNVFAGVTTAWTANSRGAMDFSWTRPAHCFEVALEISP